MIKQLGKQAFEHPYSHRNVGFGGDCCYFTQLHFVDCLIHNKSFETNLGFYLENIRIMELAYKSAEEDQVKMV